MRLTVHSDLYILYQYVCSLGIEPTTFCAANTMLYHWATGTFVILAFRRVLGSGLSSAFHPHFCRACTMSFATDFYLTVKVALRHESVDSEEDRQGLGCHLGQGLVNFLFTKSLQDQRATSLTRWALKATATNSLLSYWPWHIRTHSKWSLIEGETQVALAPNFTLISQMQSHISQMFLVIDGDCVRHLSLNN